MGVRTQTFQMTGMAELKAQLDALAPEVATKAGALAVRKAANVVRDIARDTAPLGDDDTSRTYTVNGGTETRTVDYGHLRDNIKVKKGKARKEHTVVSQCTTGNAFWGRMLEFGTEKMPAQPWFGPAADAAAPLAYQAMQETLAKAIARAMKKAGKS